MYIHAHSAVHACQKLIPYLHLTVKQYPAIHCIRCNISQLCCIIRSNEHKSGSEKSTEIRAFYRQTIILEYLPTLISHVSSKQAQTSTDKHIQK